MGGPVTCEWQLGDREDIGDRWKLWRREMRLSARVSRCHLSLLFNGKLCLWPLSWILALDPGHHLTAAHRSHDFPPIRSVWYVSWSPEGMHVTIHCYNQQDVFMDGFCYCYKWEILDIKQICDHCDPSTFCLLLSGCFGLFVNSRQNIVTKY